MIAPLLASLLLVVQNRPALDSATVARVLTQLKASDSAVCALAGEALTNYGGVWGPAVFHPRIAMPPPKPTPLPRAGGGGGGGGPLRPPQPGRAKWASLLPALPAPIRRDHPLR